MQIEANSLSEQALGGGTAASPGSPRPLPRRFLDFLGRNDGDPARVLILLLFILLLGLVAPPFISQASWLATSQSATIIILLAIGQTFVIATGGIDLSVGAVLACSSMIGAIVMRNMVASGSDATATILVGFAISLIAGTAIGAITGLVITKLEITPFIATLGMMGVATGTTNLLCGGTEVIGLPPELGIIGNTAWLGRWVTIPVFVTIIAAIIAGLILARTRFGLRTYAIGSNPGAARRAGMAVPAHLIRVYALSGLFASLGGILLVSRFVSASPLAGQNAELASIAAAVIGGASLTGGRGSILGTVIGASITAVLQIGLILAGVSSFWQTVAIGVIIVVAVYTDQLRIRLSNDR